MNSEIVNHLKQKAFNLRKHVIEMVAMHGQGYVQQGLGARQLISEKLINTLP